MKNVYIKFNRDYDFAKVISQNGSICYDLTTRVVAIDNVKEVLVEHGFITVYYIIKPNYKERFKTYSFSLTDIKNITIN